MNFGEAQPTIAIAIKCQWAGEETSESSTQRIKHLQPRAPVYISPTRNMGHERPSQVGGEDDQFWLRMLNWTLEGTFAWENFSGNWKCGIQRMNGLSLNTINCQKGDSTILTCVISHILTTSSVYVIKVWWLTRISQNMCGFWISYHLSPQTATQRCY